MLGTQLPLRKRHGISEVLLKVSWMVFVCQAVATCSSRSQWQKSSSMLANSFFPQDAALEIQDLRKKQRQDTGQHWQLPVPAVKARLRELWTGFVCADGCCALQFVNCIKFPPCHRCWHSLLCLWMWQSNTSEAQLAHWSVRLPALLQWEPNWQQQRPHWFLGALYQRVWVWKAHWDVPDEEVWLCIPQVYLTPHRGGGYFASLRCALTGVGNNFPFSVYLLQTMKFHHDRKWIKRERCEEDFRCRP